MGSTAWLLLTCLFWQQPEEPKKKEDVDLPPLSEVVTVTASKVEQPVLESTSLVTVVSREELEGQPALVLDEYLRRIPGFNLFRRSNSLSSHPTTQGVSLRGIGPSGTSRSLVLFDGLPMNDPFGGWVYWNRYPLLLLERVEVVRGAGSALFGSGSMGGTVQLLSRKPGKKSFELRGLGGNHETFDLEGLAMGRKGDWAGLVSGRLLDTSGYYVVEEDVRGAVDRPVRADFQSFFGRFSYRGGYLGMNLYREHKNNGTSIQTNRSRLWSMEGGIRSDRWNFAFYGQSGLLESRFSRILPDRDSEILTSEQRFPTFGLGSSLTWRPLGNLHLGTDWRSVSWDGNHQNLAGVFAEDLISLHPRLDWLVGVRLDMWQNQSSEFTANPRTGVLFRASPQFTLRGSGYRGFRAPTLNELYRPFRVGNVTTLANPRLRAEYLWGTEAGLDYHPNAKVLLRLNAFWNSLRDSVGNVTVQVAPAEILRQRQNIGRARIRGVESELRLRADSWECYASYLYSNATDEESGLRLPQVPLHQAVLGVSQKRFFSAWADLRWVGQQFDDDLNDLSLSDYLLVDLGLQKPVSENVEVFAQFQNLLNRRFAVGATPVERLGEPFLFQTGFRIRFSAD